MLEIPGEAAEQTQFAPVVVDSNTTALSPQGGVAAAAAAAAPSQSQNGVANLLLAARFAATVYMVLHQQCSRLTLSSSSAHRVSRFLSAAAAIYYALLLS